MAPGANSDRESRLRARHVAAVFLRHLSAHWQSLAADPAAEDRDWLVHERARVRDCRVDSTKARRRRTAPCAESDSRVRLSDGGGGDGIPGASGIRLHPSPAKKQVAPRV